MSCSGTEPAHDLPEVAAVLQQWQGSLAIHLSGYF